MFKKYTLVVVDMQPFYTTNTATINNVAREVRLARKRGNHIIFLWVPYLSPMQDEPFRPTYPEILKEVEGYDRDKWQQVEKFSQDGSRNVLSFCDRKGFPTKRFRVCGVNTDMCLLDTVTGLLKSSNPAVKAVAVVKNACHTTSPKTNNDRAWELFPVDPRLTLIENSKPTFQPFSLQSGQPFSLVSGQLCAA